MRTLVNLSFHFIHLTTIAFCLVGWMFEPFLFYHLTVLLAVVFSWIVLGYFFGFGYCLFTDLHWKFKRKNGENPNTDLYVKYVIDGIFGVNSTPALVDFVVSLLLMVVLVISLLLNFGAV